MEKRLTIDRINTKGNYEPSNCRWTDLFTQAANKRVNKNSKTGYTGISLTDRPNTPYAARLVWKKKILLQKRFKTIKEALDARNEVIKKHGLPHPIQELKNEHINN